ncbi:MAG TPA: glycosyltransferase family 1 protein [Chloroflexi bacterium]|nr:glycosyltransferase family 1 protein [Chloroflexota bacterium]
MKIVHVVRHFYPVIGGIQSAVFYLSQYLLSSGHQVEVVALNRVIKDETYYFPDEEVIDGINVKRVPYIGPQRFAIAPGVLRHILDCDLVHLHSSDFFLIYLVLTKLIHRKPIVFTTHGMFFHTKFAYQFKQIYFRTVAKWALSQVKAIVCVSLHDYEMLSTVVSNQKLSLIPNGIQYDTLSTFDLDGRDPDLLLSVGRLASNKRYDRLLQAFAVVVERRPTAKLMIVGPDSGCRTALEEMCVELGIVERVQLLGRVSEDDLLKYLRTAKVWVSSTEYESFGIALLEAMASGCVPVVQSLTAFAQLIDDGKEGFFTDFDDPQQTAAVILQAIDLSDQLWQNLVQNARAKAQQFSWKHVAQQFESLYKKVL